MQDAHLHLQDPRFRDKEEIIAEMRDAGISKCVVNGTHPEDWHTVKQLANDHPDLIIPSYGLHPWHTPCEIDWKPLLHQCLESSTTPCIGECGLDRWMPDYDIISQEDAFYYQLDLACEMNAPLSIHIVKAWGWFLEILRERQRSNTNPFPERGFLLHSYNGSAEMIPELVDAGAYFSFSGYFLNSKKQNQLNVFSKIPKERLLIETDAPDMLPPANAISHPLTITPEGNDTSQEINHPANLCSILEHFSLTLQIDKRSLEPIISSNFSRFFLDQ